MYRKLRFNHYKLIKRNLYYWEIYYVKVNVIKMLLVFLRVVLFNKNFKEKSEKLRMINTKEMCFSNMFIYGLLKK